MERRLWDTGEEDSKEITLTVTGREGKKQLLKSNLLDRNSRDTEINFCMF